VLDNFEHLIDGANLVNEILRAAPAVQVLVTSREMLSLSGEVVFNLGGLDFPVSESPEKTRDFSAVRLFIQSAKRACPGFELKNSDLLHVARICRLVQGMPLGILLAAAQVQILSPGEIADELDLSIKTVEFHRSQVMKNMAAASDHIPNVTVEIPAVPEDGPKLLSSLEKWALLGVKYLNMHELMYESDTNAATMEGQRQSIRTGAGHLVSFNPASRRLTLSVMQKAREKGYPLSVNDCSLQSKIRQVHGTRKALTPLLLGEHEKFVGYEVYETCCAFRDKNDVHFFHPDSMPEMRSHFSKDYRFYKLARTAPVSIKDKGRWVSFEEI